MINEAKILKEFERGTTEEMIETLNTLKAFVVVQLTEEQRIADELASKKQSQIERLNNSN